ncbi:Poly [ADP-ribose] polymerase tankyrase-2 [Terramyces sp. JEL0728]|nr:Poly [ADP-ribose] polymerase tankyrase-2 [Terramyces sp. JEL0728]
MTKEITKYATLIKYRPELVLNEIKKHHDLAFQESPNDQRTLLHIAAGYGATEIVELLLSLKADVNKLDKFGETPIFRAIRFRNDEITLMLIAHGANVHTKDHKQRTVLHRACEMGTAPMVKLLLQLGCDPNELDFESKSPFDLGLISKYAMNEIGLWRGNWSLNLDEILDAMSKRKEKMITSQEEEIAQELEVSKTPVTHLQYLINSSPAEALHLIANSPDIINNVESSKNRTLLHSAAGYGKIKIVQKLLDLGAKLNPLDIFGQTPIFKAVEFNHYNVVERLAEFGANLDIQDTKKRTVLHYACRKGATRIIRFLLENGCDPTATEGDGLTPLDFAIKYGVDPSDWEDLFESTINKTANKRVRFTAPDLEDPLHQTTEAFHAQLQTQQIDLENELFSSQESTCSDHFAEDGHWVLNHFTAKVDNWMYEQNLIHKTGDVKMMSNSKCWVAYIKALDVYLLYPSNASLKLIGNL